MEAEVQKRLIKFLKKKGCFVLKTKPGAGVPVGSPDIFFMLEGFWGCIECKSSKKAPYRPLQKEQLEKLGEWSYARTAYPENVDEIEAELERIL